MSELNDAIRLIEGQITSARARCVIADDGFPPESSLMGTRDGYLRLAKVLLQFVADADDGRATTDDGYAVDDRIKGVMHSLPLMSAWIVSCSLFKSHDEFITELRRIVDPRIDYPLTNDPQFAE